MTASLLTAINILTKPAESVCNAHTSQEEALLSALQANRSRLLHHLDLDPGFLEVRKLRDEVKSEWFPSVEENDHCWVFVQECLLLMLTLTRHLSTELHLFRQIPPPGGRERTPEAAPPLPPDVLSVSQQKTLTTALQFVVSLGICPYLAPGVGVPLGHRSAFGAMVEKLTHNGTKRPEGQQRLLTTTNVLLKMAELSSLATLVFTRHLGDLMAALCQLGYQPHKEERRTAEEGKDPEQRRMCREALRNLLNKVYQPIIIKELLILQGSKAGPVKYTSGKAAQGCTPSWLKRLCGQLLSERLMQPHGVQAVVRAILEGTGAESDWRKCDGVAKILVTCPQQSTSDGYYRLVCPQILDMLHFKDKLTALQFQRVATTAVLALVQEKSSFAQQYLLLPMLSPLQRCITPSTQDLSKDAVEEWELSQCVDDLYKICVVGTNQPSALLLTSLTDVLPVLFTLFCFTRQNVSHLRAPCQEIMLWYLSQSDPAAALDALRQLSGLKRHMHQVAAGFHFCPGSDGGVRLRSREDCSDEDDALYEKLSGEQWKLECLNELLSQLKDSDLPGDFFLALLQELTCWAAEADADEQQELDVSAMTLLDLEQRVLSQTERQGQRLALLQVLAVMIECLPHTLLLRKTTQVVDFIVSLLQRACMGLDGDPSSSCESPVESQTLSMAMGLVATLLSVPQVNSEDYRCMSRLLSPLDTLSQLHPEVFIQELASNLKAVIATHGAYTPDNFSACSSQPSHYADTRETKKKLKTTFTTPGSASRPEMPENAPMQLATSEAAKSKERYDFPAKPLAEWFLEACDPDVPTRAVALRGLTQLVQKRDRETVQAQEKVLVLFLENLEHEDSFVYLSAIQGLAALADSFPQRILERLLLDFQRGPSLPTSNKERSLETRLKVGEVLMRATRAMGELVPHLGQPLLGIFLQSTKDPDSSVRASSLSNLGELCQRLEYALGPLAQELSTCLTALIKTEKEAEVRRAAVHVITQLLKGLSDKTTQVLADVLLDLYRALKWVVRSDPDSVAVLHAQLALEELDDVMRKFIFPEQKLEKKIVVLP